MWQSVRAGKLAGWLCRRGAQAGNDTLASRLQVKSESGVVCGGACLCLQEKNTLIMTDVQDI